MGGVLPKASFTSSSMTTYGQNLAKICDFARLGLTQGNCATATWIFVSFCFKFVKRSTSQTYTKTNNTTQFAAVARSHTLTTACKPGIRIQNGSHWVLLIWGPTSPKYQIYLGFLCVYRCVGRLHGNRLTWSMGPGIHRGFLCVYRCVGCLHGNRLTRSMDPGIHRGFFCVYRCVGCLHGNRLTWGMDPGIHRGFLCGCWGVWWGEYSSTWGDNSATKTKCGEM